MEKIIKKSFGGAKDYLYPVARILIGLLFLQHGLQKIFGFLGGVDKAGNPVPDITSLFGAAGLIELAVGIMLIFGIFVRLAALVGAVEMLVAYFMVHFPNGFYPVLNGGELAALFFASFLIMIKKGSGKISLEKSLLQKEIF